MSELRLHTVVYRNQRSLATISVAGLEHRIVVYDHCVDRMVFDQELSIPFMDADISHDGQFVAVGYWDRCDIDIWATATCVQRTIKSPSRVSRVLFDGTGEWLLYQSERGTFAADTKGAQPQIRVAHAEDLRRAAYRTRDNAILIPLRRKGQVAIVRFVPACVDNVLLPITSVISCMRHSPVDSQIFVLDGSGHVLCYDDELRQPRWEAETDKRAHTGAYSGDGSMIGLQLSQFSGQSNVVVLDANNGRRMSDFHDRYCTGSPFNGDSVLLNSAWPGLVFHLSNGTMEEGIASKFGVRFLSPFSTCVS